MAVNDSCAPTDWQATALHPTTRKRFSQQAVVHTSFTRSVFTMVFSHERRWSCLDTDIDHPRDQWPSPARHVHWINVSRI